MKKLLICFFLVLFITNSIYAISLIDTLTCKKVHLKLVNRIILVNRFTGEVKYILSTTGKWVLLVGALKNQYQAMYDVQRGIKQKR